MHLWKPFQDKEIKHGSPLWRPAPPPPLGGADGKVNRITIQRNIIWTILCTSNYYRLQGIRFKKKDIRNKV